MSNNKTTTTHTPLPWTEQVEGEPKRPVYGIYNDHAEPGFKMPAECHGPNAQANAELIVKAVNSHDRLVEATGELVRQAARVFEAAILDPNDDDEGGPLNVAITTARALLAELEPTGPDFSKPCYDRIEDSLTPELEGGA